MSGMEPEVFPEAKESLHVIWPWNGQSHHLKNDEELSMIWDICEEYAVYEVNFMVHYDPIQVEYPSHPPPLALPMLGRGDSREFEGGHVQSDEQHYGDIQFHVGDVFKDIYHFREVLKDYVIQEGFKIKRVKNDSDRISCKCGQDNDCPWRIYAALMKDGSFMVKIYNEIHTCQREPTSLKATSPWIAKKMFEAVKLNPKMSLKSMEATLRQQFNVEVGPQRLYKAKKRILEALGGDNKDYIGPRRGSFSHNKRTCHKWKKSNTTQVTCHFNINLC